MKVLVLLIGLVVGIILLPFRILDYLVLRLPVELKAKRWRKNAKVGDECYFINLLGTKTECIITKLWEKDGVRWAATERRNGSGPIELDGLFPAAQLEGSDGK